MLHEKNIYNLLVNVAETQQGQRSTNAIPKNGDDPKGCTSNPFIPSLRLDLKDVEHPQRGIQFPP